MILRIFIAILLIAVSISSAPALKKAPSPGVPTQTQTRKNLPLTAGECRGLGGNVITVDPVKSCTSGEACETADKNGVLRRACIDNVKR